MKNYNNFMKHENGNLAVGFIKSRKAEHKVMDFCERLIAEMKRGVKSYA